MSTDKRKSLASSLAKIAAGSSPRKPAAVEAIIVEIPAPVRDELNRVKQQKQRRFIRVLVMSVYLAMLGLVVFALFFALIAHQRTVAMRELVKLVESGDLRRIEQFIAEHPSSVNAQDDHGYTPLRYAVLEKRSDVLKLLLRNGAKASIPDCKGGDALGDARGGIYHCSEKYLKSNALGMRIAGRTEKEIEEETEGLRKKQSPEDREKWLEIEAILVDALKKDKAAE